jgi:hypothetical protein
MSCRSARISGLAALAAVLLGCAPAGRPGLAEAVAPADIAHAMCLQIHPGEDATCERLQPPSRASGTAYRLCLDYHPGDARPCRKVREAYEADLRAFLTAPPHRADAAIPSPVGAELGPRRYRRLHQQAEALYVATSRDAQSFEAALLIPEVRRKVEAVIGPNLSDDQLRGMAAKSRAEALYWYEYMQGLERGDAGGR